MSVDQVTPDQGSSGLTPDAFMNATEESEQPETQVEEQSIEQPGEETPAAEPEQSTPDQGNAALEATIADLRAKNDELNRTFTQDRQAAAERLRQEQAQQPPDYSQYPEEDRAAMQQLDRMIEAKLEQRVGPLNQQMQGLTQDQRQQREIAQAKINHPGVDIDKAIELANDQGVSLIEIAARALSADKAASTATAKVKTDLARKSKANTGVGGGSSPAPGKTQPYDRERDAGKTVPEILEGLRASKT